MTKDRNDKYKAIVDYIRSNGECTTKQIGVAVFKLTGIAATNITGTYLRRMKNRRIVTSEKCIGRTLRWKLTGYIPSDWEEEIVDTQNLFKPSYVSTQRKCYMSSKGFVHVYDPGQRICNCELEKIKCH